MALKAGYYGIKKKILNQLLGLPADILDIRSEQAVLGAKNLLENHAVSEAIGGITYVVNADGSITWSGTHEDNGNIFQVITEKQKLPHGNYILTGCPSGGSDTTYNMSVVIFDSNNTQVGSGIDTGDGFTFTVPNGGSITVYGPRSQSQNKTHTVSGTFYPMVRLATDTDDTYAPYAMTNRELTVGLQNVGKATRLTSVDNLNDIKSIGSYEWAGSYPVNTPENVVYSHMEVITAAAVIKQLIYYGPNIIYMREYAGQPIAWTRWYKFTGSIV